MTHRILKWRRGIPARRAFRPLLQAMEARELMATLSLVTATVLPDGRSLKLVFETPLPAASSAPDWTPGANSGTTLATDDGTVLENIGNYVTSTATTLTWTATYLVDDPAKVITFNRANLTLTAGAGLLQDSSGNATGGFTTFTATNQSLVDVDGFTTQSFERGAGGVAIYVSSTYGDDNRSFAQAQNPATPYKTLAKALNTSFQNGMSGKGAAVRLLRGDTFTSGAAIKTSGQDARHPFVLEDYWYAYGSAADPGTRPVLQINEANTTASSALSTSGGGGTPPTVDNVVMRRIQIEATNWTGNYANRFGLSFYRGGSNWVIDDCVISNFGTNVIFQGIDGPFVGVTLLRDVITDSRYDNAVVSAHSQGVYLSNVQNALISQCTVDDNGRVSADRTGRDMYSHNIYIQSDCGPSVVWGNVIRAGGSHGIQMRSGGVLAYNYLGRNAISAFIDGPGGSQYKNVVEKAEDISGALPRGFGLTMNSNTGNSFAQTIEYNILVNFAGSQQRAISIDQVGGNSVSYAIVRHNTAVNAGGVRFNASTLAPNYAAVTNENNLINSGANRVYVSPAFSNWSWYQADNNALSTTLPANQIAQIGSPVYSLAGWGAVANGSEAHSITTAPQFVNGAFDIGSFFATVGGTNSESDYVAALRNRLPGVWNASFNLLKVYDEFSRAYAPVNLSAAGSGPGAFYGAVDYRTPAAPPVPSASTSQAAASPPAAPSPSTTMTSPTATTTTSTAAPTPTQDQVAADSIATPAATALDSGTPEPTTVPGLFDQALEGLIDPTK